MSEFNRIIECKECFLIDLNTPEIISVSGFVCDVKSHLSKRKRVRSIAFFLDGVLKIKSIKGGRIFTDRKSAEINMKALQSEFNKAKKRNDIDN